jgi:beta-phosphoglucomutase-like phosphatase (HAD superfamily)
MQDEKQSAAEVESYPLDDAAIELIAELDQQEKQVLVARNSILTYILRQHKLTGPWKVAPNRRELVRDAVQPQPQPPQV